jgi:carbonic anhydrase/acetyltransferase-like protein (isoleucine patch superfamily)
VPARGRACRGARLIPCAFACASAPPQALDRLGLALQGEQGFQETLNRHRAVAGIFGKSPTLPREGFVAPSATVVGDVTLGERTSIWYGAVLRGDVNAIKVGAYTNIQDGAIIHVAKHNVSGKARPTLIGDRVTVGHGAILHACTIEDGAFVGMGATVMDGAVVQRGAMVAAGALVTPGVTVPSGQIFAGNPAKLLRPMTAEESAFIDKSAENYATLAQSHATECAKSFEQIQASTEAHALNMERDEDYDSHRGIAPPPAAVTA